MKQGCRKIILALMTCNLLIGCGNTGADTASTEAVADTQQEAVATADVVDTNTVSLIGLGDTALTYSLEEIESYPVFEETVSSTTSSGEINTATIRGALLQDLLAEQNEVLSDFEAVRVVASDGYEIIIPHDVLSNRDVVIAYQEDEEYYDKYGAFRVIVPDERAMYWVRGTVEIHFEKNVTTSRAVEKIVLLDSTDKVFTYQDYTYYDAVDKAVKITELMDEFVTVAEDTKTATFIANDGLEDDKAIEVVEESYLKMTGEYTPLFISPDMPKGMQIKGIQSLTIGDTAFVSLSAYSENETVTTTEFPLIDILSDNNFGMVDFTVIDVNGEETQFTAAMASKLQFEAIEGVYYLVDTDNSMQIEVLQIVQ
ncbi:MAG: hypothetical protein R3Y53_08570 [Bacillota bacterium]